MKKKKEKKEKKKETANSCGRIRSWNLWITKLAPSLATI